MEGHSETCKVCGMAGGHAPDCPAAQSAEDRPSAGPGPDLGAETPMSDEEHAQRAAEAAALLADECPKGEAAEEIDDSMIIESRDIERPEAKEVDAQAMAKEMAEAVDQFVEDRYAYVSGFELCQGLAEMLAARAQEIAASQGLELSEEQAEEMVESLGIDDASEFVRSDLPEHLQGPEDGTNFLTVKIGDRPVMEVSSMGDGYGASLDEFDEAVVQQALNSLADKIKEQAEKA